MNIQAFKLVSGEIVMGDVAPTENPARFNIWILDPYIYENRPNPNDPRKSLPFLETFFPWRPENDQLFLEERNILAELNNIPENVVEAYCNLTGRKFRAIAKHVPERPKNLLKERKNQ